MCEGFVWRGFQFLLAKMANFDSDYLLILFNSRVNFILFGAFFHSFLRSCSHEVRACPLHGKWILTTGPQEVPATYFYKEDFDQTHAPYLKCDLYSCCCNHQWIILSVLLQEPLCKLDIFISGVWRFTDFYSDRYLKVGLLVT